VGTGRARARRAPRGDHSTRAGPSTQFALPRRRRRTPASERGYDGMLPRHAPAGMSATGGYHAMALGGRGNVQASARTNLSPIAGGRATNPQHHPQS
jgi:hypothetical protein